MLYQKIVTQQDLDDVAPLPKLDFQKRMLAGVILSSLSILIVYFFVHQIDAYGLFIEALFFTLSVVIIWLLVGRKLIKTAYLTFYGRMKDIDPKIELKSAWPFSIPLYHPCGLLLFLVLFSLTPKEALEGRLKRIFLTLNWTLSVLYIAVPVFAFSILGPRLDSASDKTQLDAASILMQTNHGPTTFYIWETVASLKKTVRSKALMDDTVSLKEHLQENCNRPNLQTMMLLSFAVENRTQGVDKTKSFDASDMLYFLNKTTLLTNVCNYQNMSQLPYRNPLWLLSPIYLVEAAIVTLLQTTFDIVLIDRWHSLIMAKVLALKKRGQNPEQISKLLNSYQKTPVYKVGNYLQESSIYRLVKKLN